MFLDDEVFDWEFNFLAELLAVVDSRLHRLMNEATDQPWDDNLYDSANHVVGFGFVACQRYVVAIVSRLDVGKAEALRYGPRCSGGPTVVGLINAAANAWKHEAEWKEPASRSQKRTLEALDEILKSGQCEYKYLDTLGALSPTSTFSSVATLLEKWREALRQAKSGT